MTLASTLKLVNSQADKRRLHAIPRVGISTDWRPVVDLGHVEPSLGPSLAKPVSLSLELVFGF